MTNKEALECIKERKQSLLNSNENLLIDIAIKALEKQTKKKVIPILRDKPCIAIIGYGCPNCHKDVVGSGYYCWNCGQALDWSEQIR